MARVVTLLCLLVNATLCASLILMLDDVNQNNDMQANVCPTEKIWWFVFWKGLRVVMGEETQGIQYLFFVC